MHPNGAHGDRRSRSWLQRLAIVAATILAGLLACGTLLAVLGAPVTSALAAPAASPVPYPGGGGCTTTLQACIDNSPAGTTILVQPGTYFTNGLTLSKAVSLTGVSSATVILQALVNQRVLTITSAAVNSSVIISGLTFAGGHAVGVTCPAGCGGAVLITATAQPLLINLTISNSQADFFGGGLFANTGSPLFLSGVAVVSNTSTGGGGALAFEDVTLIGGLFQNNKCNGASCGGGGGLLANLNLTATNTQFIDNSSLAGGGGLRTYGTASLNGGLFQNNQCTAAGCQGGGLLALATAETNTEFIGNMSNADGGGLLAENVNLNGALFQNNQCTGASCVGGGLFANGNLTASNSLFLSNSAIGQGGGANAGNAILNGAVFQNNHCTGSICNGAGLFAGHNLTATNSQFLSNTSTGNGGGALALGNVTLDGDLFLNNQCTKALCQGGGLVAGTSMAVTNTRFIRNTAQQGAGLAHFGGSGRLVNDLFAANTALAGRGDALGLHSPGAVSLLFTTVASPSVGGGSAIYVTSGTVTLTDTLLASYTVGIENAGGSVQEDYTLFAVVTTHLSGTVAGCGNCLSGPAGLINPVVDDYHLALGSLAIDHGVEAGINFDIDGDPRPLENGFDIGFDEANIRHLFLALVRR